MKALSLFISLFLLLTGCFYSVRTSLPGHIKSIAIPVFENRTLQSAIENDLTQVVTDRFRQDNHLSLAEARSADAVLEGTIATYDNKVYRFNNDEQAEEYIVTMTFNITVKDRVKNKDLWSQEGIRASATYLLGTAQARTEADARKEIEGQIADIILSRTVEGW